MRLPHRFVVASSVERARLVALTLTHRDGFEALGSARDDASVETRLGVDRHVTPAITFCRFAPVFRHIYLAYQLPVSSTFHSKQSHQRLADGTFLTKHITTSHQPNTHADCWWYKGNFSPYYFGNFHRVCRASDEILSSFPGVKYVSRTYSRVWHFARSKVSVAYGTCASGFWTSADHSPRRFQPHLPGF